MASDDGSSQDTEADPSSDQAATASDQPDTGSDQASGDGSEEFTYGEDETQDFVDRSVIDFDPKDGLYTGTAVSGESDIPGPSEGEIREAQENLGGEDQGNNTGEKAAAEKYIEEHDVDLEEAKKGEAIAGSAQTTRRDESDDDSDEDSVDDAGGESDSDGNSADDDGVPEDHPKPFPHDGKGPDADEAAEEPKR